MNPVRMFLTALLAGPVAAAGGCTESARPPVAASAAADTADQVMFEVRSFLTNAGIQRGVLYADTVFVYNENSHFEFRGLKTEFNKPTGVKDGVMTGKRGRYDIRNGILEGFGDVVITTTDGKKVTSPHLRYDQGRNVILSDSAFVLTNGSSTQRGVGFETDPQLNRFQCKSRCGGSAPLSLPVQ